MIHKAIRGKAFAYPLPTTTCPFYKCSKVAMAYECKGLATDMAKAGKRANSRAREAELLGQWHDPVERDNSIKARAKRGLQLGSIRAVERVIALMESEDERVAFAAAREILQRNFGMPKQDVSLAVTDTSAAHHAALKAIYDKAAARLAAKESAPPIDHNAQVVDAIEMQPESDIATGQTLAIDAGLEQDKAET